MMDRWARPKWVEVLRILFCVAGVLAIVYGILMAFATPEAGLGLVVIVGGAVPVMVAAAA